MPTLPTEGCFVYIENLLVSVAPSVILSARSSGECAASPRSFLLQRDGFFPHTSHTTLCSLQTVLRQLPPLSGPGSGGDFGFRGCCGCSEVRSRPLRPPPHKQQASQLPHRPCVHWKSALHLLQECCLCVHNVANRLVLEAEALTVLALDTPCWLLTLGLRGATPSPLDT